MAKFANYIMTVRKSDGVVLSHSYHYPAVELVDDEKVVDIALSGEEFNLLEATRSVKRASALVKSIEWKAQYWGKVELETGNDTGK